MALNIKDPEAERLAAQVAALSGESKTGAVRTALRERRDRLSLPGKSGRHARLRRFLVDEAWPQVPEAVVGKHIVKAEREAILGFGPDGV